MKTLNTSSLLRTIGLFFLLTVTASASVTVNFNDFSDTSSLKLNGATAVVSTSDGKVLRLTPAQATQSGSAFSQKTLNTNNFSTFFKFRITNPGGTLADCNTKAGADGLVFVIQSVSESIGGAGYGIGYAGIDRSVGVEFDTWCNAALNDPNSNHLGIVTDGNIAHAATAPDTQVMTPDFDDGNIWYAWIDYDGATLEVRTNQTGARPAQATLSKKIDISSHLTNLANGFVGIGDASSNSAFVGFTSGTGADWGDHDIISWEYRDTFEPINSVTPNSCPKPDSTVVKFDYLGVCQYTQASDFTLTEPANVGLLRIWYDTNKGTGKLNVNITGPNGYAWTGQTVKGSCDPYQTNWCEGLISINDQLAAGTYSLSIDSVSMCKNPSGQTTLVVYGCPLSSTNPPTGYTIATSASPSTGGSVVCTPNPVASGSGSNCTASANSGYNFASWAGDCAGSGPTCSLNNINTQKSVTALFNEVNVESYTISTSASPGIGGSVVCTPNPVQAGNSSTCTATANNGYNFTNWSGDCSGTGSTCVLSNINSAKAVMALFITQNGSTTTTLPPTTASSQNCLATYNLQGLLYIPFVSVPDLFGGKSMYEANLQLLPQLSPLTFQLLNAELAAATQTCSATYSLDGKLHIPFVSVPDAFGGKTVYEADMQLLSTEPVTFVLKDAKTATVPQNNDFQFGASQTYSISSSGDVKIQDTLSGNSFRFPKGGNGKLIITAITSAPQVESEHGNGFKIEYSGIDPVQILVPYEANQVPLVWLWGDPAVSLYDSGVNGSPELWMPLRKVDSVSNPAVFILSPTDDLAKSAQLNPREATQNTTQAFKIFQVKLDKNDGVFERLGKLAALATEHVQKIVYLLPSTIQGTAVNEINGRLHPKLDGFYELYSDKSYYHPFSYITGRADPYFVFVATTIGGGMLADNHTVAHEAGHYMSHVLLGDDGMRTLEKQAVREHGKGTPHAGRPMLEEYAYFSDYCLNFADTRLSTSIENFFDTGKGDPASNDWPSEEGYATSLLALMHTPNPWLVSLNDTGVSEKIPFINASLTDLWGILAKGPTTVDKLHDEIAAYLNTRQDLLPPLLERSGWSYHGKGRVVDDQSNGVPSVKVQAVVKVPSEGADAEYYAPLQPVVTNTNGEFTLERMFPATTNNFVRVWLGDDVKKYQDFSISIDSKNPTNKEITLPDFKVSLNVTVPDVVGQTKESATQIITEPVCAKSVSATCAEAKLNLGSVTEAFSKTVPIGQVISQSPSVGQTVKAESKVDIVISKGPEQGPGGSVSGTFPDTPFNGMQIDYSFSGGAAGAPEDSPGFTTSRTYTGTLGSGTMTLSGTARMGNGYGADLSVSIWAGSEHKEFNAYIKSGFPSFNEQAFSLTIPIPADALDGGFSVDMTGNYNAGSRGLVVSGSFTVPK